MIAALDEAISTLAAQADIAGVLLDAEGSAFFLRRPVWKSICRNTAPP